MSTYVSPQLNCRSSLFLKNPSGTYIKWPHLIVAERTGSKLENKGYALRFWDAYEDSCRELISNSFGYMFDGFFGLVQKGYSITTTPPKNKLGVPLFKAAASLEFRLDLDSPDLSWAGTKEIGTAIEIYRNLGKIVANRKAQTEVFALMDIFLGSIIMLTGSPQDYLQSGDNPLSVRAIQNFPIDPYFVSDFKIDKEIKTLPEGYTILKYTGVSSFVINSPALLSLSLGMARFAIEAWADGLYPTIDREIKIDKTRKTLVKMSKKKTITTVNRIYLLSVLKRIKNVCLATKKVKRNIGAYPINDYTWPLVERFLNEEHSKSNMTDNWAKKGRGVYSYRQQGFLDWCSAEIGQTKRLKGTAQFKRMPTNKSGHAGFTLYT